jgi:uncharacterized protein (TIGR02145 family)
MTSFFWCMTCFSQPNTITLSFAGDNNGQVVLLESVWVRNLTKNCDTTLYPPDLALVIGSITSVNGNPSGPGNEFHVSQNYPNPCKDHTEIDVSIPRCGAVELTVSNLMGHRVAFNSLRLDSGKHHFIFYPGDEGMYILSVRYENEFQSVRMMTTDSAPYKQCILQYMGNQESPVHKSEQAITSFEYVPGDQLLFVGYHTADESGILDSPVESKDYQFQFATNIPCPEMDSVYYDGKFYHTIQIFSQCWMVENLDAGTMIPGSQMQSDNGVIEKYCYANNINNCNEKGGLYIWDELMQYNTQNIQGICPEGWHVPDDEEWKILEGVADSQFGIGHSTWNNTFFRGTDVGKNLKSTSGWSSNGNGTDLYGFAAVAPGYWWQNGFFENTNFGIYWTSTLSNESLPLYRGLRMDMSSMARMTYDGVVAQSVRCLKN